jgi:5-formyltetrahydrofolate cyclo-ligase
MDAKKIEISDDDLRALKKALRKTARQQRSAAALAATDAGSRLAGRFLAALEPPAGTVVSAFWPLEGEIDTLPLIEGLIRRGCQVVLPVMQGAGLPLVFRAWTPGEPLVPAGYGTHEPATDKPEAHPSLLIVPLLAFDRAGYRLGYGGGFYDRTLAGLRRTGDITSVGIAFAGQEVAEVPRGRFDQCLDFMVTEKEVIEIG